MVWIKTYPLIHFSNLRVPTTSFSPSPNSEALQAHNIEAVVKETFGEQKKGAVYLLIYCRLFVDFHVNMSIDFLAGVYLEGIIQCLFDCL